MNTRPFPKKIHQAERGFIVMEAVFAAVIALATLASIAPMFSQQIELSRRARDTDLIEAAASKDANAMRQFARYWRMKSGPYTSAYLNPAVTGFIYTKRDSEAIGYQPAARIECFTKDDYMNNFIADLKPAALQSIQMEMVNPPGRFGVPVDITPTGLASRYKLTRNLENLSADPMVATLRVSYVLTPLNGAAPLAFQRTAELQLEMHNGC